LERINLNLIKAEKCRRSFYYFLQEFWSVIIPEAPVWNWHIEYLCNELQAAGERVIRREKKVADLIINTPPGISKSTIFSIAFPVWLWINDPTIKVGTISYSADVATGFAAKSRYIIENELFKAYFPDIILTKDVNAKSNYSNTRGGSRIALSTGGKLTGMHFHCLIADDIQNASDADSETQRKEVNEWVGRSLSSRKVDNDVTLSIFIQQRLHPKDSTAFLLSKQGKKYNHISLPAELSNQLKPIHLKDKYVNNLLDPIRLSLPILQEKKIEMGSKAYNTQYGQSPEDEADAVIKRPWIPIITLEAFKKRLVRHTHNFYTDTAFTDNTKNDPSAIIAAVKIDNILYVLNALQVWEETPDYIKTLQGFAFKNGYDQRRSRIVIEPHASGYPIYQTLKRLTTINIVKGKPASKGKLERLKAIAPSCESGRVVFVEGEWNDTVLDQLCSNYPVHDDIRDCIVMAAEENLIVSANKGKYHYIK
jgi:predicted phage terminase large subunit-like protein